MTNRTTVVLALPLLFGCAGESATRDSDGPCANSSVAVDDYVAGLSRLGEAASIEFVITDADPSPPARGTNRWIVQLRDADGKPLLGGELTQASGWMPDHGHGSGSTPTIATDANGDATIEGLELVMPGVWTITLSARKDATEDSATFSFCIDG